MWVHIPVVRVLVSYNLCCVYMQIRKIKLNDVIKASCAKKKKKWILFAADSFRLPVCEQELYQQE
jgi:hypothetical protein